MARTDNLTNFLTDVADAIREKKGTTGTIQASNFDTEIANISTGGFETTTLVLNDEGGGAAMNNTYLIVETFANNQSGLKVCDANDFFDFFDYQIPNSLINGFIYLINTSYKLNGDCLSNVFSGGDTLKVYKIIESTSYNVSLESSSSPVDPQKGV